MLEDLGGFLLLRNRQEESKNLTTWGEKEQLAKIFNRTTSVFHLKNPE